MSDEDSREERENDCQTYYSFRDGLPTGPDVALLMKEYPDLKAGDRMDYERIGEIIGAPYKTNRFSTVTDVWRRRLADSGIVTSCIKKEAFVVLTADEISDSTYQTLEQIGRKAKKQRKNLATIKPSSEEQSRVVMHRMRLMHAVEQDSKKHRMNLLPSSAIQTRPQISPPNQQNDGSL